MKNKKLKYLIIYIICFCIFLFLLETGIAIIENSKYISFKKELTDNINKLETINKEIYTKKSSLFKNISSGYKNLFTIDSSAFRQPSVIENSNKKPIFFFGCSFAYGIYLEDELTFHYLISTQTKRSTYNFALVAASMREALYILRNYDFTQLPQPEYIIYTYIADHKKRLYEDTSALGPLFEQSYDKQNLIYYEPFAPSLRRTYIMQTLIKYYAEYKYQKSDDETLNLINLYFKEMNRAIKKKFPETKFVIFVYDEAGDEKFNELSKEGIIVIKAKDIIKEDIVSNTEFRIYKENYHPNSKVWKLIVPKLIKELNL